MGSMIGFLGIGHLAQFIIKGLVRGRCSDMLLFGRNRELVQSLVKNYGCLEAKDKNQLLATPYIALCVRPNQVQEALQGLYFEKRHTLISFVAGVGVNTLQNYCEGEPQIVRVMPNSAAEVSCSCNLIYPDSQQVRQLLANTGGFIDVATESQFEQTSTLACLYASIIKLQATLIEQVEAFGVSQQTASKLVHSTFKSSAVLGLQSGKPAHQLADEIAWEGTLSKEILDTIVAKSGMQSWVDSLKGCHNKLMSRGLE